MARININYVLMNDMTLLSDRSRRGYEVSAIYHILFSVLFSIHTYYVLK